MKSKEIAKIIRRLAGRDRTGNLCSFGIERLKWWRQNGSKFTSPKAAVLTWNSEQVYRWFSDRNRTGKLPLDVRTASSKMMNRFDPYVTVNFSSNTVRTPVLAELEALLKELVAKQKLTPESREWVTSLSKVPPVFFNYGDERR